MAAATARNAGASTSTQIQSFPAIPSPFSASPQCKIQGLFPDKRCTPNWRATLAISPRPAPSDRRSSRTISTAGLVGGASLEADSFAAIVETARA